MKQIFIVQGSTGEYSDHQEWFYKAYYSQDAATKVAEELNAKLLELGIHRQCDYSQEFSTYKEKAKLFLKEDPKFSLDYTGSDYTVVSCDITEE